MLHLKRIAVCFTLLAVVTANAQSINLGLYSAGTQATVQGDPDYYSWDDPIWFAEVTLAGVQNTSSYTNPAACANISVFQNASLSMGMAYQGRLRIVPIRGGNPSICSAGGLYYTNASSSCWNLWVDGKPGNSFEANQYNLGPHVAEFPFTFELRPTTNAYPIATWSAASNGKEAEGVAKWMYYKLKADGKSRARAFLRSGYDLSNTSFNIAGDARGCTLTTTNGYPELLAGTNSGTVHVQASVAANDEPCLVKDFHFDLDACGSCETCGNSGTPKTANNSVDVRIDPGPSYIGNGGYLQIKQQYPTTDLGSPRALKYNFYRPDIRVISDSLGQITQIQSSDRFISVDPASASSYTLKFYRKSAALTLSTNGLWATSDSPFRTITIENVGGDTNHFRVTDSNAGIIADYLWLGTGWAMTTGGGLRTESKEESWNGNLRTVVRQVRNVDGQLEHQTIETWDGPNLIQSSEGSGSEATTNYYTYDGQGNLLQSLAGDGSWAINQYDAQGRLSAEFRPFLNSAPSTNWTTCRLTTYSYNPATVSGSGDNGSVVPNIPRCITEYVLGNEVGRRYNVLLSGIRKEIRCINPGVAWNNTNNLVQTTWLNQSAIFNNQPDKIVYPDGVTEVFSRSLGVT